MTTAEDQLSEVAINDSQSDYNGGWPSFPAASHDEAVAPAFAIFEGWAFLLPGLRDFPDSHLRSPRLIDQNA